MVCVMIIICKKCGMSTDSEAEFCQKCGSPDFKGNAAVKAQTQKTILTVLLILSGVTIAMTLLIWILNLNLLLPWQRGARRNKQVILEYAEEHYPDAQVVEGHYNSARIFVWNNLADAIVFNLDDIEFTIIAEAGKILTDNYPKARAYKQFDTIIQDGFLKPRGIEARTTYNFLDNYKETYPYTGSLVVRISVDDQGSDPREAGWLYDFYWFWHNEGAFLESYDVWIKNFENGEKVYYVDFKDEEPFLNEDEFYSSFRLGD